MVGRRYYQEKDRTIVQFSREKESTRAGKVKEDTKALGASPLIQHLSCILYIRSFLMTSAYMQCEY